MSTVYRSDDLTQSECCIHYMTNRGNNGFVSVRSIEATSVSVQHDVSVAGHPMQSVGVKRGWRERNKREVGCVRKREIKGGKQERK